MGDFNIMTFIRGTLDEFKTWHNKEKARQGIPPEGKIGEVEGVPAPNNQRTYNVTAPIVNPQNKDEVAWKTTQSEIPQGKQSLSEEEFKILKWVDDKETGSEKGL